MRRLLLGVLFALWLVPAGAGQQRTLKVGVLCSRSGSMAGSEQGVLQATLLAIEEINAMGGLSLDEERRVLLEPVVADGASDPAVFAAQALRLRQEQGIQIFFGCWTSDARRAVARVLEPRSGLLFYPVQFEGQELSRAVVYSGMTANQQLFPALDYLRQRGAKRFYLVGSDYVYPRVSHALARRYLTARGAQVVGEAYRPRGTSDWAEVVTLLRNSGCDAVLNTINGDSLVGFFRELQHQQVRVPVMSLSLGEAQALRLGPLVAGQLTCWGYYMTLDNPTNARFLSAYREKYGAGAVVDDPGETAYWQVHAFALAAHRAHSARPSLVRAALQAMIVDTPGGLVRYDPRNLYSWRTVRIAQADGQGRMHVVWSSELPRKPEPWPR